MAYRYIISLGTNLGDLEENLKQALKLLKDSPLRFVKTSRKLLTEPLRDPRYETKDHGMYLNLVAEISSQLAPVELYKHVVVPIEDKLGHCRLRKWASRTIDIDLLACSYDDGDDFTSSTFLRVEDMKNDLVIPHKELSKRAFLIALMRDDLKISPREHWFSPAYPSSKSAHRLEGPSLASPL